MRSPAAPPGDHAEMSHHPEHAAHADADRKLVDAQPLAGFIDDHRHAPILRRLPQRPFAVATMDDDRRTERLGEAVSGLAVAVDADLRQVGAVDGRAVEVDAEIAARHHFGEEDVSELRGERSPGAARKAAVEVAPVGKVAAVADEAEGIDDRHHQQGAAGQNQRLGREQPPADGDAGQLVAMDRGADEQGLPFAPAVDDADRKRHRRAVGERAHRQVDEPAFARRHLFSTDAERGPRQSSPSPSSWSCQARHCFRQTGRSWRRRPRPSPARRPPGPARSSPPSPPGRDWSAACRRRRR